MTYALSRTTGQSIDQITRFKQAVADVLTTPIGSRVLNRSYGSRLFDLIDQPFNAVTKQRMRAASVEALRRHIPEIKALKIDFSAAASGGVILALRAGLNAQAFETTTAIGGAA